MDLDIQAMKFGVPLHRPVFQFLFSLWIITLFFFLIWSFALCADVFLPLCYERDPDVYFFSLFARSP